MNEINALDFIGKQLKPIDIMKAEEMLKMNYGIEYPAEKFSMLWEMIKEEHWTDYRLKAIMKWFLKNKRFPNWTIADWFDYGVKLYGYAEYLNKLHTNRGLNEQIEWYNINGVQCWKYKDGTELPFEKVNFATKKEVILQTDSPVGVEPKDMSLTDLVRSMEYSSRAEKFGKKKLSLQEREERKKKFDVIVELERSEHK